MLRSILIFVLLTSCSSLKKGEDNFLSKIFGQKESKRTSRKRIKAKLIAGSTLKNADRAFLDKTKDYGLEGVEASSLYAVDFNGDKWTDLVILKNNYSTPSFFEFDPLQRKFVKLTYSPFSEVLKVSYLYFVDMNKDGVLDVIAGNMKQKTELIRSPLIIFKGILTGKKINFQKIKNSDHSSLGHKGAASIAVLDFDLDGNLDIFEGNWFDNSGKKPKTMPDVLLKGKEFEFKNVSGLLKDEYKHRNKRTSNYMNAMPTFGVSTCDLDQNGYPDILTTSTTGYFNKLWMNVQDKDFQRMFVDHGKSSGYAADKSGILLPKGGGNSYFSSCIDYNNDGIMDIFLGELTHSYDHENRDRSSILTGARRGYPPKYIRTEFFLSSSEESWTRGDRRGVWIDYNSDGFVDLVVDNSGFPPTSRLILLKQHSDHSFEDVGEIEGGNVLNPSGTISIDLNEDGLTDIITGQTSIRSSDINKRIFVFQNNLSREKLRSIKVNLQGEKSNRGGIGALVILKTNQKTYRRWVEYFQGLLGSQNEDGLTFGLSANEILQNITVKWPILKKKNSKSKIQLVKKYNLLNQKIDIHKEIMLCEDGRFLLGRADCN